MFFSKSKSQMPDEAEALPGRETAMPVPARHAVRDAPLVPPFPDGMEQAVFGMGCFWGAERKFWETEGAYTTAVGYAGGFTPNPTYEEVCSGQTGHTEVVLVVFDPARISYEELQKQAEASRDAYQQELEAAGYGRITTEIREASAFYYAEDYHQQYLHKNPGGYCNHGFCQVAYDRQDLTRVELPSA